MSDLLALVTTYNEQDSIAGLVQALRSLPADVLVIDDCSSDQTAQLANLAAAHVFITPRRIGIARCLRSGYRIALSDHQYHRLLQIDAGGSHDPCDAPALLADPAHLVIGSRFLPNHPYTGALIGGSAYIRHSENRRDLASRFAARLCNLATGRTIHDWTSGYRAFTRPALEAVLSNPPRAKMHASQIDALASVLHAGLSVSEVPITYIAGRSSFNRRLVVEALLAWLRLWRKA